MTVVGDGSGLPVVLSGDKLGDREALLKAGKERSQPKNIADTRKQLGDKVFE